MTITKTKPASKLAHMATALREKAKTALKGTAYRRLDGGLHIVFQNNEGACRLAIGREAPTTPSDTELRVVAEAFEAPPDSEPTLRQANWQTPTTERTVIFNILELKWREL
ncbi:MAG: hypothetical protein DCC55_25720 [Chloroflexi bacterium]|nr:MAG: hypothetical protein DCC55_25720 [Chloroflexota bacterium]